MTIPRLAPAAQRREEIAELAASEGFVRVPDLARRFDVSVVTVRSDLSALESEGKLRRVHGGAVSAPDPREHAFEETAAAARTQKDLIGEHAANLVRSGQSIALDVGTTTAAVARALVRRADLTDLTIITNGLNIALLLEEAADRFTIIVTGGTLRRLQHSLVDPLGTIVLDRLAPDVAIVGCNGVSVDGGITNINLPEAQIKAALVARAASTIVVADSSKLGQVHLGRVCDVADIDRLVTDSGRLSQVEVLREADLTVDVADLAVS